MFEMQFQYFQLIINFQFFLGGTTILLVVSDVTNNVGSTTFFLKYKSICKRQSERNNNK